MTYFKFKAEEADKNFSFSPCFKAGAESSESFGVDSDGLRRVAFSNC